MPTQPTGLETRDLPRGLARVGTTARADGQLPTIHGYGAVFYREGDPGTEYELWGNVVERILPGAFDRALREDDVRSFFNHDPNQILGRSTSGTLRLSIDEIGLRYEVDPPESARGLVESLERGDVDGSSFMFVPDEIVWREVGDLEVREVVSVQLWEVGPVVFPAYESSTSGVRDEMLAEARAGHQRWRSERAKPAFDRDRIARRNRTRLRTLELE